MAMQCFDYLFQVWRRGSAAALGAEGHRFNPYHLDTVLIPNKEMATPFLYFKTHTGFGISAESNSRKNCKVIFS